MVVFHPTTCVLARVICCLCYCLDDWWAVRRIKRAHWFTEWANKEKANKAAGDILLQHGGNVEPSDVFILILILFPLVLIIIAIVINYYQCHEHNHWRHWYYVSQWYQFDCHYHFSRDLLLLTWFNWAYGVDNKSHPWFYVGCNYSFISYLQRWFN